MQSTLPCPNQMNPSVGLATACSGQSAHLLLDRSWARTCFGGLLAEQRGNSVRRQLLRARQVDGLQARQAVQEQLDILELQGQPAEH